MPRERDHNALLQVLIVDDQTAVRSGLRRLLASQPGLPPLAVDEAANIAQAREAAKRRRPDLVLLDVDLAGDDGLTLLPLLEHTTVVVITSYAHDRDVQVRALNGGAAAVVPKALPASALGRAILAALGTQALN